MNIQNPQLISNDFSFRVEIIKFIHTYTYIFILLGLFLVRSQVFTVSNNSLYFRFKHNKNAKKVIRENNATNLSLRVNRLRNIYLKTLYVHDFFFRDTD